MNDKHNFTDFLYSQVEKDDPELFTRLNKKDVITLVNTGIKGLKSMIKTGEPLRFHGFGIFELYASKRRVGRNPQTGETIKIPPRKKVKFRTSKAFADEVIDL